MTIKEIKALNGGTLEGFDLLHLDLTKTDIIIGLD